MLNEPGGAALVHFREELVDAAHFSNVNRQDHPDVSIGLILDCWAERYRGLLQWLVSTCASEWHILCRCRQLRCMNIRSRR